MENSNAYSCLVQQFIRWLDRSIFDLFLNGLKKTKLIYEARDAGISLFLPSQRAISDEV